MWQPSWVKAAVVRKQLHGVSSCCLSQSNPRLYCLGHIYISSWRKERTGLRKVPLSVSLFDIGFHVLCLHLTSSVSPVFKIGCHHPLCFHRWEDPINTGETPGHKPSFRQWKLLLWASFSIQRSTGDNWSDGLVLHYSINLGPFPLPGLPLAPTPDTKWSEQGPIKPMPAPQHPSQTRQGPAQLPAWGHNEEGNWESIIRDYRHNSALCLAALYPVPGALQASLFNTSSQHPQINTAKLTDPRLA